MMIYDSSQDQQHSFLAKDIVVLKKDLHEGTLILTYEKDARYSTEYLRLASSQFIPSEKPSKRGK